MGGTWYWNRYPGARFDSESYTYGYLFSQELFDEWEWQEHFAEQPETERYLNHRRRFDLRRHMRFGARVTSASYDEATATWTVTTGDDAVTRGTSWPRPACCRCPLPGRTGARTSAASRTTRVCGPRLPSTSRANVPLSLAGSSGVQIVPVIAPVVESLTVYQRTANWCTPLNNADHPRRTGAAPGGVRGDLLRR